MKSYLIVEEHKTKTLKIIPYSEYLLNKDNVFLYEIISDANTEDEAALILHHINEFGGIQEYFNEVAREAKKEVEKNKEDIQEKELENYLAKYKEYNQKIHTCGERSSYSKTDNDATFMRMKEDHLGTGQLEKHQKMAKKKTYEYG